MKEKTATYHASHIKVSCFTLAMRNEFQHFSTNAHDGIIMHFGYPDLVFTIMQKLARHGFTF